MEFKQSPQSGNSYSHMWDVASMKTYDGGFLLDKATVPADLEYLPKGAFLACNLTDRKAKFVKTAVVHENVTAESTTLKIKKGHFLKSTDVIGTGTKSVAVGTIDTSDSDYDSITIVANSLGALTAGAILQSYKEAGSNKEKLLPNAINPFDVKIDSEPTVSGMFRADGIVKSRLPQKVAADFESALPHCQFLTL
ncbi:hypothetical protein [Leadbetterella byssophila]|uniref:hypothetical protein n=1 Tax=Leadbetterella byssophila TaxID=316068 RepID=UPI00399F3016